MNSINELNEEEKTWLGTEAEGFLWELERMSMDKLYKIPTISCFIEGNKLRKRQTLADSTKIYQASYRLTIYQKHWRFQS